LLSNNNCEVCGEPAGIRVSQFHFVCSEDCKKEYERSFPPQQYLHCTNCDYICTEKEIIKSDGRRCPSCGDDNEWPPVKMTQEEIQTQLEWQREIKEKGTVNAIIDRFLNRPQKSS